MSSEHCLVFSTCPDTDVAARLARLLVERQLAACVNILPKLTSIYLWRGAVESTDECLLLIKTIRVVYPQLQAALLEHHPYELPEIVMVQMDQGLPAYLQWITQCVTSDTSL